MANVEEVVIRIDVKSPDNDGDPYVAIVEGFGEFPGKTKGEAISLLLADMSETYKGEKQAGEEVYQ